MSSYTPIASSSEGTDEWPAGPPVAGFKNLIRLSVIVLLLSLPNLACQIYTLVTISSTGNYGWSNSPASAVWACGVCILASTYMLWVGHAGTRGRKGMKGHLAIAISASAVTCVMLVVGLSFSSITAVNAYSITSDSTHFCLYFDSTFSPTEPPPVTIPSSCYSCNPQHSWGEGVARSACCCCSSSFYWVEQVTFYDVPSCEVALNTVFPVTTTSAVLFGTTLILMFVSCLIGCIVGCQCFCCSTNCGPFIDPHAAWNRCHPQVVTGYGNPHQTYTAVPVANMAVAYNAHQPAVSPYITQQPVVNHYTPQPAMAPPPPPSTAAQNPGYSTMPAMPPTYDSIKPAVA